MSPLYPLNEASEADLDNPIREVRPVALYFATNNRNAWHSTWISGFESHCMHHTIASAKAYCERRCGQGTVFSIEQMPALAVIGADCTLAITEINTDKILQRLSLKTFGTAIDGLARTSMTVRTMVNMLNPESQLWPVSYPRTNSAILVFSHTPELLAELRQGHQLYSWKSRSAGAQYRLGWIQKAFNPCRAYLRAIAARLSGRIQDLSPDLSQL
jgi:hypothetical protein